MNTMDDLVQAQHELYVAAVKAGFDEHQALHVAMGKPCCDCTYKGD